MVDLENKISELIKSSAPNSKLSKNLSKAKRFLKTKEGMTETVHNVGNILKESIKDNVGGVRGSLTGWVAGKTTNVVGGLGVGVISAAMKTVATIIPDGYDTKGKKLDEEICHLVETYPLPVDKQSLFELLQFLSNNIQASQPQYGEKTLAAMKKLQIKVYDHFVTLVDKDDNLFKLAKSYAPKKRKTKLFKSKS